MKKLIISLFVVLLAQFFYAEYKSSKHTHALVVMDSLIQVKENLYVKQTATTSKLKIENSALVEVAESYQADIRSYQKLIAHYQASADSITTVLDTVYASKEDSTIYELWRYFSHWIVPDEFHIKGRFQTQEPYLLNIEDAILTLKPEITLMENQAGIWAASVHTNSDFLTIEDIDLQVQPRTEPLFDLKPKVYGQFLWPSNTIEIESRVRIWKLYPFARISTSKKPLNLGIGIQLYGN